MLNPAAGGGRCEQRAVPYLERLRDAGLKVEVRPTSAAGEGTQIVKSARRDGYQNFIAIGGDGTAFEVLNGVLPRANGQPRPRIGFLPLGTGNSFLRDFSTDGPAHGLAALLDNRHRCCDVLELSHDAGRLYAFNVVSFGFPASVADLVNRRLKSLGEVGYGLGVLAKLLTLRATRIRFHVQGLAAEDRELTLLAIMNSRFVGGRMLMAPDAVIDDGQADMICVEEVGRFELLRTFPKIFKGTHILHPAVTVNRIEQLAFADNQDLVTMIDGEVIRLTPRRLQVLANVVDVFV